MSDVETLGASAPEDDASQLTLAPRPGMFADPVVRMMAYAALSLVILFLVTVLGALFTNVGRQDGPRTEAERQLLIASEAVKTGVGTGGEWAPYINALVANGNLSKARVALDSARASVRDTATAPELDLAEARIELAQKRYTQAVGVADKAMKGFEARQAARLAAGGDTAKRAKEMGIEAAFYEAALVKAYAYVGQSQWKDAVGMFDVYMRGNPTAADILIDRGDAKASMKDNVGAEKDFRDALRFVPNDKEAQAGLKRIGAAR